MADATMEMKIPEQFIADTIRAELVRQMPNKEAFAAQVIKSAMEAKKDSYSRTTVFQDAVANMIREEAEKTFKEWIAQNREAIRTALLTELTRSKAARVKKIAEQIVDGMTKVYANVRLSLNEEEG